MRIKKLRIAVEIFGHEIPWYCLAVRASFRGHRHPEFLQPVVYHGIFAMSLKRWFACLYCTTQRRAVELCHFPIRRSLCQKLGLAKTLGGQRVDAVVRLGMSNKNQFHDYSPFLLIYIYIIRKCIHNVNLNLIFLLIKVSI